MTPRALLPSLTAALVLLAACKQSQKGAGGDKEPKPAPVSTGEPDEPPPAPPAQDWLEQKPTANWDRGIEKTTLEVDASAHKGRASIRFEPGAMGAALEVDGLDVESVRIDGEDLEHEFEDGHLVLGLPASEEVLTVDVVYTYKPNDNEVEGVFADRITMTWPYLCGQVFPCHSEPADGTSFAVEITNVPEGQVAVYPKTIVESPSYQLAWAIDDFEEKVLGKTKAGTTIVTYAPPEHADAMAAGTKDLVAMFEFFEETYGPYHFGDRAGSVAADWEGKSYGGMEHHPYWHMSIAALRISEVHAHEAAHGWYGDAIRIKCWENLTLSEGTVSYMAARAIEEVEGEAAAKALWKDYKRRLDGIPTSGSMKVAWPEGCGEIDVLEDRLFGGSVYMKGAHFFRALEGKLGKEKVDASLRAFYAKYKGKAAGIDDLLDTIKAETDYDAEACAIAWLRSEDVPKDQFDSCE